MRRKKPVSWTARRKAARIVGILRQDHNLPAVARFLGLPEQYISFAERMTKSKRHNGYVCPHWVIRHILNLDLMQADITEMRV